MNKELAERGVMKFESIALREVISEVLEWPTWEANLFNAFTNTLTKKKKVKEEK